MNKNYKKIKYFYQIKQQIKILKPIRSPKKSNFKIVYTKIKEFEIPVKYIKLNFNYKEIYQY